MDVAQHPVYIDEVDAVVKNIAMKIKSPGFLTEMLLKGIRLTEYDDVDRTIGLIETTVVN